jgi:small-conductance mechanosensitive channel
MNSKPKRVLLRILSLLMLLAALPMLLWCWGLINNAALDYTYAGVGCFAVGIAYIFSMVSAIAGLVFAGRLH